MTGLRPAFSVAGLPLAAIIVLALPLSAQAGGHGCNCAGGHPAPIHTGSYATASAHTSAAVHVQTSAAASAYGHAGGYVMHAGYGMPAGGYSSVHAHEGGYPPRVAHYPVRYPSQGAYASGGYDHHGEDRHGYGRRRYGSNSYALIYAPTYGDSGYATAYPGGYGYAAPASDDTGDYPSYSYQGYSPTYGQVYDSGDYAGTGYGYDGAPPPADDGYEAGPQPYPATYADTGYSNVTYNDQSDYTQANYAPPPPAYGYGDATAASVAGWRDGGGEWHCGPSSGGTTVTAYGWRDLYGEWHVTSETTHTHYSYSYSY